MSAPAEKRKTPEELLKELEQKHLAANRRVTQAKEDVLRMQSVLVDAQQALSNVLYDIITVKEQINLQREQQREQAQRERQKERPDNVVHHEQQATQQKNNLSDILEEPRDE